MKTYRELYFKGTSNDLDKFKKEIGTYAVGDWKFIKSERGWEEYLFFDYKGKVVDRARVSIIGKELVEGQYSVGNIIPLEKDRLNIDEYNAVLLKFYEDVIKPFKESGTKLIINQPTDDIFDPTTEISPEALKKLELFCDSANKSTGSLHPYDKERWFDFICQTVDDNKIFDYSTLANFLQDTSYWKSRNNEVMGRFAWEEEKAYELAQEYENACEILKYYKESRLKDNCEK